MSSCSNLCGSKQTRAAAEGGYQRYGVRSYLHQFYEDCTTSIWEYEDDFQIQRSPNRWSSVFWKVVQAVGFPFPIFHHSRASARSASSIGLYPQASSSAVGSMEVLDENGDGTQMGQS
ncbi:neurensin 1 [Phyllostomus discolor]|uniref:Neurensin 1 n=1 Tax=Phyllostomus discolor TaxID=89673 RepID=A0A834A965_9CHIR|nr:neurensin 1 [Phyllostomus discolor]